MVALGGAGVAVFAGSAGMLAMLLSNSSRQHRVLAEITVPASDLPEAGAAPYSNSDGQFFLIHNTDGALALSWSCTHQGCSVRWQDANGQFECPCHEARYDRYGVVVGGPAPRPLDVMPLRLDSDGNAIVDTRRLISREEHDPAQAVPIVN
jgi:cytochrome b6-f complex iron-sulfur subunit